MARGEMLKKLNPKLGDEDEAQGATGVEAGDAGAGVPSETAYGVAPRIGPDDVKRAMQVLEKYRAGKQKLDQRIIENQQWYRLRHWENLRKSKNPGDPEPASAWLLNSIANKHADAMDNYPEPVVLPREAGDQQDAEMLSAILPTILDQNQYESAYSDMWWNKLKAGTGVQGVFWNTQKLNGLGDIDIRVVDLLNLFWEPGVKDVQKSRNLFHVELVDNDILEGRYEQLRGKLSSPTIEVREYTHDESIDTSNKSAVVDWYYKVSVGERTVLHYVKFVNGELLYASENDAQMAERGFYDHGLYPFVFDTLFPDEDSPAGFGYLDVCKDPQMRIDKLNQVIVKNAVMSARPRFFLKGDGGINEAEYADWEKDFVHYTGGGAPSDNILPIQINEVSGNVMTVLMNTVEELKETSGNRDFSQGGTASGVTAASAIAALQEAGSKLSRDMIKASYRAFTLVSTLCLELMRQFYDEPRYFRVVGQQGADEFVQFDNTGMRPQSQGMDFGVDMGVRVPVYDIVIKSQKSSPFSVAAQNEMAKEFYAAGFFNPQMSDQALACLEMMTFEGKERVIQRVSQNGTLYQQLMMMQQQMLQLATIVDAQNGSTIAQGVAQAAQGMQPGAPSGGGLNMGRQTDVNALGKAVSSSKQNTANTARERAQNVTEAK